MSEKAKAIRTLYRAKRINLDGARQAAADGIITECGSHEELLEKDGIYAALYKTQNALALEALK